MKDLGRTGGQWRCEPARAHFISRDPMVMTTRSAYGYVGGNPLNGKDPSGQCDHWWETWCQAADIGRAGWDWVSSRDCIRNPFGGDNGNGGCETTLGTSSASVYLGILSAISGAGAIVGSGAAAAGLGATSIASGLAASTGDVGACAQQHEASACIGAGLGFAGAFGGIGALINGCRSAVSVAGSLAGAAAASWDLSDFLWRVAHPGSGRG